MTPAPPIKIACCVLGIVAAGAPLLWFTQANAPAPRPPAAIRQGEMIEVAALVRWSAAPSVIRIRREGAEVCAIAPSGAAQWSGRLQLPAPAAGELELEVEAEWPTASGDGAQAISLELLPPKQPALRDTQWTEPGERMMHQLFIYPW